MSFNTGSTFQHRVRNLFLLPRRSAPPPPATVLITFEGLQQFELVQNYYNGGLGSMGSGPGPNYGVVFSDLATCALETDVDSNFYGEPSYQTIAYIYNGLGGLQPFILNKPDGFVVGCSFYYVSNAGDLPIGDAHVAVYDGLDGTGNLLAQLDLPATPTLPPFDKVYNNWQLVGLNFAGTAKSIKWMLWDNQTGLDDIRFGV